MREYFFGKKCGVDVGVWFVWRVEVYWARETLELEAVTSQTQENRGRGDQKGAHVS